MGCQRKEIYAWSEFPVDNTKVWDIGVLPESLCEGHMVFAKYSTGDEIYIEVKGRTPSSTSYFIKLTDTVPTFEEDSIIPGQIRAISNVAAATPAKLSVSVSGS
jgi:hypothetical protein